MRVNAGIWIDHQRTLIVITFPGGEKSLELRSNLESLPPDLGSPRTVAGRALLERFYTAIITAVHDAKAILIFGTGAARTELLEHLQRARLGGKVIGVEAAERMTEPQLAAKVREHFQSMIDTSPVGAGLLTLEAS